MKNLIDILENTLHLKVYKKDSNFDYKKSIPFIVKKSYDISAINIENIDCVVLIPNDEDIKSIKKHLSLFSESLTMPIILNISNLSNSTKKYLIDNNISFVSNDTVYLPQLLIYLKDISSKPKKKINTKISKLAQMILIFELLKKYKNEIDIYNCAEKFNVTQMSASRALKELYEFDYLKLETIGRKKIYHLNSDINIDEILLTLKNPKIEDIYIKSSDLKYFDIQILSSYSALSHYTNIINNENIYAIDKEYFAKHINKNNQIEIYNEKYDNSLIQIELWKYQPNLIQENIIDPISLYLSLKEDFDKEDTRLENSIDELYNKIKGMIF
ncbi:helix-turn-helix domain-containing protein [Aliarcobacter butzleri]|uniref:hypothetical protein n=1 Tax=Aliarcobacter butzleri TaxID=28197 RepID=UPI0021B460EE|nr:hypothetical protein [Aliarcobacter butzleri]MCT7614906.1 hypothetical protein [Aliarcobacter butzleri]